MWYNKGALSRMGVYMILNIKVSDKIYLQRSQIDNNFMDFIKKYLFVELPQVGARGRRAAPKQIYNFESTQKNIILPRGFLFILLRYIKKYDIKFKLINKTVLSQYKLSDYHHNLKRIPLYGYQKKAVKRGLKVKQGLIVMPCGSGKTRTLIEIIRRADELALIIVNSDFLIDQWREYILKFFGFEPGLIKAQINKPGPITLTTIQTLKKLNDTGNLNEGFLKHWGTVVIDEVHHLAADSYQQIIPKFHAQYRLGTTATLEREDGLTRIITHTMGKVIYRINSQELEKLNKIIIPEVSVVPTKFNKFIRDWHKLSNAVIRDKDRNEQIIDVLIKNQNRFNLVLSSRIEHLETLANLYHNISGMDNYRVVTSKVKQSDRKDIIELMKQGDLNIIFATQLADEGLDIPVLDTLHLVFPTKSRGRVEQRVGRTQRIVNRKNKPIIYDYVDGNSPILMNQFTQRRNLYKSLGLKVKVNEY